MATSAPPALAPREAAYAAAIDAAMQRRLASSSRSLLELRALLERIWTDMRSDLLSHRPGFGGSGGWTASDLAVLDSIVGRHMARLDFGLRNARRQQVRDLWTIGSASVPAAVDAARTPAYWGGGAADGALLGTVADYQDSLVTRLTQQALSSVRAQIRLGVLGAKTPSYIMQDLAKLLGTPERENLGPLWRQVDTVWRTESMNLFNLAAWQRAQELARQVPGLRKRWRHGGGGREPRPYHQRTLNGQTLPWDAPFRVVTPKGEEYAAMFPHDPSLPPGEVISCTCSLVLVTWPEPQGAAPAGQDPEAAAVAGARLRAGRAQLEWIRSQRPDLLQTPDGKSWIRRYRRSAWEALEAGY